MSNSAVSSIHNFAVRANHGKAKELVSGVDLDKLIRQRLVHARELNKLNQLMAAERLGYKNSTALSKIEGGTAKVPKNFLVKAAQCYGVSMDYLMGLSSEPERDPKTAEQHAILNSVRAEILRQAELTTCALLANAADMTPMEEHVTTLLKRVKTVFDKFDLVCVRNPQFMDDVIAGSSLFNAVNDAQNAAVAAERFMGRRSELVTLRMRSALESAGLQGSLFEQK